MLFAVLIVTLFALGHAQTNCDHSNTEQLKADIVIDKILVDLDTNKDRHITDLELLMEFVGKFDKDANSKISKTEFLTTWAALYKDVPTFAEYMFCHFDMNGDGVLDLYDVPMLKARVDIDIDGIISELEFDIFMTHLYLDCVPHTHLVGLPAQNNGFC